ncbi:Chalcone--flavonone isomerase [Platanthera guangdongensis]|uniref:Chalcone-flavonone isomerase family protein n=1 Tax=Platanthera guangdongensis TaxID=2320717 RepID=A0ABR2M8U7_9ASPA
MGAAPDSSVEVEGVNFLAEITSAATSKTFFLGGAGVRGIEAGNKFMAVTSIGIYLEVAAIPAMSEKWKGKSSEELGGSDEFYRDIITGPFEKLTKVTMLLPLTGQQYSEKVSQNCVAAWKAANVFTKEEETAINDFLQIFKLRNFPPGASIIFTHSTDQGSLSIEFLDAGGTPEAAKAVIENEKLMNAVLESIIGEGGVSPAVKQSLAQRISEVLRLEEDDEEEIAAVD